MKKRVVWSALLLIVGLMGLPVLGILDQAAHAAQGPAIHVALSAEEPEAGALAVTLALILSMLPLFGTTLAVDKPRTSELGEVMHYPVIAADIIFEGAAVGLVDGTGHARPLTSSDRFVGFANRQVDNSLGAAAAKNAEVVESGLIHLSVSGAVITDVGQPVYATDDDAFVFSPVGAIFVGFVHRFVSAGKVVVKYNAPKYQDPYGAGGRRLLKSAAYTVTALENGTTIFVDTTAVITLPLVEGISGVKLVNIGAFGLVEISANPAALDMIEGPGITAADDKDIINTLATARRGDYIVIDQGDANGWSIVDMKGTWARQA